MKSDVSQGTVDAAFHWVHVLKAWFTCVCWSKNTEHVDDYFFNAGELVPVDSTCDIVRDDCKSTSLSMNFPSSMVPYALVDMSTAVATVSPTGPWQSPLLLWPEQIHPINWQNSPATSQWNLSSHPWCVPGMRCFGVVSEDAAFCRCSSLSCKGPVWLGMCKSVPQDQWHFCLCPVILHLSHSGVWICHTESRHRPWSYRPVCLSSVLPPFCACCCGGKL